MTSRQDIANTPNDYEDIAGWIHGMPIVAHLGVRVDSVARGSAKLVLPYSDAISYRSDGGLPASAVGALVDFCGGSAVATTLPKGTFAATFDFIVKVLTDPRGDHLIASGHVTRPGKSINVAVVEVHTHAGEHEELCAVGTVTMHTVRSRPPA